ncbi:DNA repair protein RecN [Enterococcus italicus]|uniref:DNA repair protein RecN n=1 Tax=Enterococcus italicus (strain DSM 15952 / CCUG 50447 / LMG 22039 / TP 1.5) TaxID=888064 RepID=E6LCK4_ENTI1|nr:DNA repair protein RecN [Enterococcus italicus]EFU75046.1 DNA repair protein RecN [Enterococcus italicus DSM 15952]OJG61482.1 DNA repair protein RecN [Enterococcus italicus DSM 15952]
MLIEMTIENFAIIESLTLSFHEGMTTLTGETGAGKSIIIDALGLLAGSRASVDVIRQGADRCHLEGVFDWPKNPQFFALMQELLVNQEEDYLVVQRDIALNGKSICRVNGHVMTLANLKRIGRFLVDIQGQNEHQSLLQADQHQRLLDEFGGSDFQLALTEYKALYKEWQALAKTVLSRKKNEQSYVQRLDMLRYQVDEIEQAELVSGEEESLSEERDKLLNFQKIVDAFASVHQLLSTDDHGVLDNVSLAANELESVASFGKEYELLSESLTTVYYQLQDVAADLSRQMDLLEFDEQRLHQIEDRLEIIHQLKRKYGESVEFILAYYEKISLELLETAQSDGQLDQLESLLKEKEEQVAKKAAILHENRKEISRRLEKAIMNELRELYMEHTQFAVRFEALSQGYNEFGKDDVLFYLSANPGEPLRPLEKVASGGEISRILLALKTVFSTSQELTSIVFDEVDTGVSGRVAQAIAEKISQIGRRSQVLCITHLPQVAAFADFQYFISKTVQNNRTKTTVVELTKEERVEEIARMLAGAEVTTLTKEHAKELLRLAQKSNR